MAEIILFGIKYSTSNIWLGPDLTDEVRIISMYLRVEDWENIKIVYERVMFVLLHTTAPLVPLGAIQSHTMISYDGITYNV